MRRSRAPFAGWNLAGSSAERTLCGSWGGSRRAQFIGAHKLPSKSPERSEGPGINPISAGPLVRTLKPMRRDTTLKLVTPVVVIALVIVEPVDIVVQHISIARRQPLIIRRLSQRINDVVQKTVVETPLIEIGLHFAELLFSPRQPRIFFFARVSSTPDMLKILPDMGEYLRPPLVATVALIPIVIPVLCKSH